MSYWIFKANPETYRIDDRMLDPKPTITWAVTRYQERIKKDDTVFIWRAGVTRGICAVMTVDAFPYQPSNEEIYDGYEVPLGIVSPLAPHWARCVINQRIPLLEAATIKKIPGLELFSFFSAFQQAVNFSITRPEALRLLGYLEHRPADEAPVKAPARTAGARQAASRTAAAPAAKKTAPAVRKAAPQPSTTPAPLLKCEECGRFVVSSDTERHVREAHNGLPVEWRKVK